jgi:2'-aminobiphenyl-2,3-diol 1,2-dioxygenase large subunit
MRRGTAGDAGERAFRGMQELGRRVAALKPDLAVIVSSDHFYNFHDEEPTRFLIGTAESYRTFGDMDIPVRTIPGAAGLARAVVAEADKAGFALASLDADYRPDHGLVLPYLMIGMPDLKMLPVVTNLGVDGVPTMQQGWELGGLIRKAAAAHGGERIVVLGTGGLSHWLGVPEMGRVNSEFDREVMDRLISGDGASLASWTPGYILEHGGNGGLEIVNWAVMAGTLPGARGERVYYEALPEWMSGLGGVELFADARQAA